MPSYQSLNKSIMLCYTKKCSQEVNFSIQRKQMKCHLKLPFYTSQSSAYGSMLPRNTYKYTYKLNYTIIVPSSLTKVCSLHHRLLIQAIIICISNMRHSGSHSTESQTLAVKGKWLRHNFYIASIVITWQNPLPNVPAMESWRVAPGSL